MKLRSARRPVVIGTAAFAVLALGLTGTAAAKALIDSNDIVDNSIRSVDIRNNSLKGEDIANDAIGSSELRANSVGSSEIASNAVGGSEIANGSVGLGDLSATAVGGIQNGVFVGEHWGVMLRNTKGSASADLRSGPFAGTTVAPPMGKGSVQLLTGDAISQVTFGNEVDFAGKNLLSVLGNDASYSVYATGEDLGRYAGNVPSLKIELDPNVDGVASNYSTLNFTVTKPVTANNWTTIDTTDSSNGFWWLSGNANAPIGCTQAAGEDCTFAEVKQKLANATVMTVGVGKGTDYQFQGAVDALRLGNTVFDFEARGVFARNA